MRQTYLDRVAAFLRAHPHEWVSAYVLMDLGGKLAFRTRCSECRTQLGMDVRNRVRRLASGEAISEYQFVPAEVPQQASFL